ncbi:hypothetical protein B0H19DRAFT_1013811 [Mycena capillaripes]|nr:hypothetical protein B0H19DRAFT_1013811 [Mycena capillaripes]
MRASRGWTLQSPCPSTLYVNSPIHPMRAPTSYGPAELAHGPMFIGFFFNVVLYGAMIIQTYLYFTTLAFANDKTWAKIFVVCIFVLDTLNTFFDFAYLYDSLIIHFGDVSFLARANWLFATDPVITATIAFLIQLFYAWRVKVLTGKIWLALFVAACSLAGLVGGIVTTVEVLLVPHFSDFIHFKAVVIVWLVAECVADVLITAILVTHLSSLKTGINDSDMLIDRIIRITMQTGLATSLCATIDLILFLSDTWFRHLVFNIPLCKLYTNSLLSSLNARNVRGPGSANSRKTAGSETVRVSGQVCVIRVQACMWCSDEADSHHCGLDRSSSSMSSPSACRTRLGPGLERLRHGFKRSTSSVSSCARPGWSQRVAIYWPRVTVRGVHVSGSADLVLEGIVGRGFDGD